MPTIKYKWNETKVDIIASELNSDTMDKIKVKKLTYFFETLGIKWMGETTVEKFVQMVLMIYFEYYKRIKNKLQILKGLEQLWLINYIQVLKWIRR